MGHGHRVRQIRNGMLKFRTNKKAERVYTLCEVIHPQSAASRWPTPRRQSQALETQHFAFGIYAQANAPTC